DFAHTIAGLRVNEWISILAFAVAIGFVVTGRVDPAVPDLDPWDTHPGHNA
ncbi:MAG: hypothetical protein JJD93_06595, partial [Ilumatobacteraceae bacterium]|nr:hypothetical protein [Ilumatobacteraceae bacterium]